MKRIAGWLGCLAAVSWIGAASAQMADAGSRESLVTSEDLYPFSVGVDYLSLSRNIEWDGGAKGEMDGDGWMAFFGVDPVPWLTVYLAAGMTETSVTGVPAESSDALWSFGMDMNLWQYDLTDPEFMEGRLSLRGGFEGTMGEMEEGDWTEWSGFLTANYEIFVRKIQSIDRVPYSLVLSAGPAFSILDGDAGGDFEGADSVGLVYGADLFVSHTLSVGFHVQDVDSSNYRISARYRF